MSFRPAFQSISGVGKPRVIVTTDVVFTSSTNTTYTSTNATVTSGAPVLSAIRAGMRISSLTTVSGQPDKPTYGKVLSVDDVTDQIAVESWYPTTPTNGKAFTVDGWIIDLPMTKQDGLIETFEADENIHNLWRNRLSSKFYGWKYTVVLDYSNYVMPDTIIDARHMFNRDTNKAMAIIPHIDRPGHVYNVVFNAPISLSPFGRTPGYKRFALAFRGKETVASFPIVAGGYGYGYAENYGVQY